MASKSIKDSAVRDQTRICVPTDVCPVCDWPEFIHIRGKLHCKRCHVIIFTCCSGES